MDILLLIFVFMFGTIIGSFLNVVIYRYNTGISPFTGRSHCFSCGKTLSWRNLVPLFSFLVARGRCSTCKVRLSLQYPIIEAITGFGFVAIILLEKSPLETAFLLGIFSVLVVIAVYDIRHKIIPDGLAFLFALLSLAMFFSKVGFVNAFYFPHAWTLIAGPLLFFPFWFLWFISQGRWLGLGDGKLAWGMGWFLGAAFGGSAVILAFWIGALYSLVLMGWQKIRHTFNKKVSHELSLKSEIPFGPFLILATLLVLFFPINLFDGSFDILSLI